MTMNESLMSSIARTHLHIPTLKCRKSDHLDFHTVSVWAVESALLAAFRAGEQAGHQSLENLLDDAMGSDDPSFTSGQIEFIRQRIDPSVDTNQPQPKGES